MSAQRMLGAMIVGSVVVMLVAARHKDVAKAPPVKPKPQEKPWLTREAEAQLLAPDGSLGPLFRDLRIGASTPLPEVREHIAEFAKQNHVGIDLDISDDELVAVRLDITFGGCCGYEGADALAVKLGRPHWERDQWINDWSRVSDDGIHMHVAMHVNRIEARWERALTATDVLARADAALDSQTAKVRKADPDRFVEIEQDHYLLDLPYAFGPSDRSITLQERELSGLVLNAVRGRIAEVTFSLRRVDDDAVQQFRASLRARWGQPRVKGDTWAWTKPDRMIEAESVDGEWLRITIRSRLPAS